MNSSARKGATKERQSKALLEADGWCVLAVESTKAPRRCKNTPGHGNGSEVPMQETRYGYCHCGCGQLTKVSPTTSREKGWTKGEPHRFVNGHNSRGKSKPNRYAVQDCGYETPCWVWQLARHKTYGYGHTWNGQRVVHAHTFYWEQRHGPVPPGLELDHLCRNRACVNPDHLEAVTHTENVRRGVQVTLTPALVAIIRERLGQGHRHKDIAAALGVGKSAVTEVSAGRSWR